MTDILHIGSAAGFSGDRTDAALPVVRSLIEHAGPSALIFETLAERTLALAQLARRADPARGYEPLLDELLTPILGLCLKHGIPIISNFGAANPPAAALRIRALARELGLPVPRIAVLAGDDLSGPEHRALLRKHLGAVCDEQDIVCANAYQGADQIAMALREGAQIVVAGRVADPSLTVGPAMAHYGWRADDWQRLGRATMVGHLLECGAQVTGGYFADPGYKEVPDLYNVGFPIAEIDAEGDCIIGKAAHTGGLVSEQTVKEQLIYELHDPSAYLTPDVIADISDARVHQLAPNRVQLEGVRGRERPADLKVNVFSQGGWFVEGEISYAGPRAEARARLAGDVLQRRLGDTLTLRVDLIGAVSVFADDAGRMLRASQASQPIQGQDIRLRVAATHADRATAERLAREVNALYTCGPAGGGGVRTAMRTRLNTFSCLIPREALPASYTMLD